MRQTTTAAALLWVVGCVPVACIDPGRGEPEISVLVVTLGGVRADRVGAWGAESGATPELDRLATEGWRFERAYVASPQIQASLSTLHTGLLPPTHGVRVDGAQVLDWGIDTLAERLRAVGYRTFAVTSSIPTLRRFGFDQGFEVYDDRLGLARDPRERWGTRPASAVVDRAIELLSTDEAVFGWVHLADAEAPWEPDEARSAEHPGRPYDAELAEVDAQLGRLVAAYRERHPGGLVVITADHGEALGDAGEWTHGMRLHDGTLRVPLVLLGGGLDGGVVTSRPVGLVDLAGTLLDIVGVPRTDGRSAPLEGDNLCRASSGVVYHETLVPSCNLGVSALRGFTDAGGRYVEGSWGAYYPVNAGRVSVFGRREDPDGERAAALAALVGAIPAGVEAPRSALDHELVEGLVRVGYVGAWPCAGGAVDPRDVLDSISEAREARTRFEQGLQATADDLLAGARQHLPGALMVDVLESDMRREHGQFGEAEAILVRRYERFPTATNALQLAALAESRRDGPDMARWCDAALADLPQAPEALACRAHAALMVGDRGLAGELCDELTLDDPEHPEAQVLRAALWGDSVLSQTAQLEAQRAVEQLSWQPRAWRVLGGLRRSAGDLDGAREALLIALRLDPIHADTRVQLAEVYSDLGQHLDAVRLLGPLPRGGDARTEAAWVRAQEALALEAADLAAKRAKWAAQREATDGEGGGE